MGEDGVQIKSRESLCDQFPGLLHPLRKVHCVAVGWKELSNLRGHITFSLEKENFPEFPDSLKSEGYSVLQKQKLIK